MTESPFISHLRSLADREDRGALAALRRGLGRPPGTVPEMHPHVVPYLREGPWTWRHQCHYIVAALFALHPTARPIGNLGDTLRRIAAATGSESVEKRFVALLNCHRDDLFDHLRQAVSLAKSKDVPVDWETLFRDVQSWDDERRWVQRNWSRSFWGAPAQPQGQPQQVSAQGD